MCSFVGEFHFPGSRDPDVVPLSVLWFSIKKEKSFYREDNEYEYYDEGRNIGNVMR